MDKWGRDKEEDDWEDLITKHSQKILKKLCDYEWWSLTITRCKYTF